MSAVPGRYPDDMNAGIPAHHDGVHPMPRKSAFEWWYFDGRFADGHTFAGTIQGKEPQVYMLINTPAGEQLDIRVDHPREAFSGSTERCELSCGENWVRGSYPLWEIHMTGEDEYMIFTLRRGETPDEREYRHFLRPPRLGG